MNPSSRTPEGEPNQCPICGKEVRLEPSRPPGDAPCPNCGASSLVPFAEKFNNKLSRAIGKHLSSMDTSNRKAPR